MFCTTWLIGMPDGTFQIYYKWQTVYENHLEMQTTYEVDLTKNGLCCMTVLDWLILTLQEVSKLCKILYFGKVLRDGNVILLMIKNWKHYKSSIRKKVVHRNSLSSIISLSIRNCSINSCIWNLFFSRGVKVLILTIKSNAFQSTWATSVQLSFSSLVKNFDYILIIPYPLKKA